METGMETGIAMTTTRGTEMDTMIEDPVEI